MLAFVLNAGISSIAHAQTLTKYAQQKQREMAEKKRMERTYFEKACQLGTLSAYNEYLSMYPKGQYVEEVKLRISNLEKEAEKSLYDNACRLETTQALQEYIDKYPNGLYVKDARIRMTDIILWQDAKKQNTIAAYRYYLNTSTSKSYSQLANAAITDLESIEEWNCICNSSSKTIIDRFIKAHPNSSCIDKARKRYNELLAIDYYEQGDLQHAYEKFEAAGGRYAIDFSNRSKYDECQEYIDFKKINTSDESELMAFLQKYPSGKYSNQVSNMVAMEKARGLSMLSGEYKYNEAMFYAKDKYTRNYVQSYIDKAKRSYRKYKRSQKWQKHKAKGKFFLVGLEIMDVGLNPSVYEESEHHMDAEWFYNVGLSFKIGNYTDPIQFEVGTKAGLIGYTLPYGYEDESESKFHLPFYARLKINLLDAGRESKFYIDATGYYNSITDEYIENNFAISGGFGVAWRHWDWSVYYKGDINKKYNLDNDFLATSFKYYF